MDYIDKYKINELTPVEFKQGIYFKRDDLYKPFEDIPLSGGKVRQCICLLANNYEHIKNDCNGHVATGTGMSSPQGIIVSRVAKEFGFKSTIFIGNTKRDSLKKQILMKNIVCNGGVINLASIMAYDNVLNATIDKYKEKHGNVFHVKFGINLEDDPESILGSVSYQVQNLPKDLDYLFVPCGSCIMFAGIIQGLEKYGIYPKHIVGIQISGYDRTETIEKILGEKHLPYEFFISKDFDYHKPVKLYAHNIQLDWLYEGKAYYCMKKYFGDKIQGKKVAFWIVGNSTPVRTKVFNKPIINK